MRQLIFCLALLTSIQLSADTIGDVEYALPSKNWKQENAVVPQGSESIVYLDATQANGPPNEFFIAHKNDQPAGSFETAALEKAISFGFPGMTIKVTPLKKNDYDVLYEWTAMQDGKEKMFGMMRVFARQGDTVILQYLTQDPTKKENARKVWVPILEQAHVTTQKEKEKEKK